MQIHHIRTIILTAAFLAGVAACGGGTQLSGGGIGGTGVSQGPVTQFGSIFVNGVEFDTANATITKDGSNATQGDLRLGMVVTVNGSIDSSARGTASTVTYAKELEGPITAATANTLTLLGQTVVVDNLTRIEVAGIASPTIGNLQVNDTIEVSGLLTANGIRATFIEKKSPSADVELKGVITGVGSNTFTIGALTVDISAIVPSFAPAVGDYVEAKGSLSLDRTKLFATSLKRQSRTLGSEDKEKAELQGFVTAVISTSDFMVDVQRVQIDAQTKFVGGLATDIKSGVKLEVEGTLKNGIVAATKVSFEDDLSLEGNVQAVSGNTITLDTYPNIAIEIDATLTEGAGNSHNVGDHVQIRARKLYDNCTSNSCTLLATELASTSSGGTTAVKLQGHIDAIDLLNKSITVLGVTVDTSTIQDFGGEGITDSAAFFIAAQVGNLVEVNGTQSGGVTTWQKIELER